MMTDLKEFEVKTNPTIEEIEESRKAGLEFYISNGKLICVVPD